MNAISPIRKLVAAVITAVAAAAVQWVTSGHLDPTTLATLSTGLTGAAMVWLIPNGPPTPPAPAPVPPQAPLMAAQQPDTPARRRWGR